MIVMIFLSYHDDTKMCVEYHGVLYYMLLAHA